MLEAYDRLRDQQMAAAQLDVALSVLEALLAQTLQNTIGVAPSPIQLCAVKSVTLSADTISGQGAGGVLIADHLDLLVIGTESEFSFILPDSHKHVAKIPPARSR